MPSIDNWDADHFRLFLCHIALQKKSAGQVRKVLVPYGITGFVAHDSIEPTTEWLNVIEYALSTCDALAALLTPRFHQSNWTDNEVGICLGLGKLVIPVRLGIDPYGFLAKYQGLDGREKSHDEIASDLFKILVKHEKAKARMATALVAQLEDSGSFATAKWNLAQLKQVTYLDKALISRLRIAVQENSQVSDSFGVPEGITSLIKKHR